MIRILFLQACAVFTAVAQTTPQTPPRPRPAPTAVSAAPATANPRDLKYPPLRAIDVPRIATFTLSNGMKIFLMENHELPVITGTARIRTGNLFDPPDKVGLALMTGMVIRTGGTREMTGEQLDRRLEDKAASVESSINETEGQLGFTSMAENGDEVLEIFRDVLTKPAFRLDQVDLARMQLRSLIARRNDDANGILTRQFTTLIYGGDNPYGWNLEYPHLDNITRSDLQAFYKRYFFPKNVMLAVSGDFDTARMKDHLEQLFGGWTVDQPPVPAFPKVTAKPAPGTYFAKKSDVNQTFFAMGLLGGRYNDKDYPALTVMAAILGGGFTSRLNQRLINTMGNAYNISADWKPGFDHPGIFAITGSSKSVSTVGALKAIQQEVERMASGDVSEDEVRQAKERALNSLVFASDTRRKVLNRTLNYAYFGYPEDFLQQYQVALAAVTRADVQRVSKQYLRPSDLTTVAVGNPEEFVPALESMGPVRDIDLTIAEPKVRTNPPDTASLEQGKRILARLQQAVGGVDKIAAVKDYTIVREVRLAASVGGINATETERWMAPGNLREDLERPTGRDAEYTDGKSGWVARGRASQALTGAPLKGMQSDLFRSYFSLLLSDRIPGRVISSLDADTVEISNAEGMMAQLSVNPETGLPQRISYSVPSPSGPPILVQEIITQLGEAGGLRVPFQVSSKHNGNAYSEDSVKDYKVNSGLVLAELERRP